jgi:enamine deaminase RidA (YjgF/YER057c/UK114 family)
MKKEIIDAPGISKHLKKEGIPLSAVVRAGGFVFVSGQPPVDRRTGKIPLVNITKQTKMVARQGGQVHGLHHECRVLR